MPAYTKATYKALLSQMLDIGVENCYDDLPECTDDAGHDWQLRENVTTMVDWDDGDGPVKSKFPWAIQCTHCEWACCL
jgi:hypothetical protein